MTPSLTAMRVTGLLLRTTHLLTCGMLQSACADTTCEAQSVPLLCAQCASLETASLLQQAEVRCVHARVLQRDLVIFGRTVAQPRLIAYMADPTTPPYTYSGLTLQPMPWAEVSRVQL